MQVETNPKYYKAHSVKVPCWWGSPSGSSAVWMTASAAGSWCGLWNCLPAWCAVRPASREPAAPEDSRRPLPPVLPTTSLHQAATRCSWQSPAKSDRVNSKRQRGVCQVPHRLAVVVGKSLKNKLLSNANSPVNDISMWFKQSCCRLLHYVRITWLFELGWWWMSADHYLDECLATISSHFTGRAIGACAT